MERERDSRSVIDEIIKNAMRAGEFKNLPGEGKPLNLGDDEHTPEHLRMAHKIMRENDIAPAWISDGKELDALRTDVLKTLRGAARTYMRGGSEVSWANAQARFHDEVKRFNQKVLSYNLKLPSGLTHKPQLNAKLEIQRALESA